MAIVAAVMLVVGCAGPSPTVPPPASSAQVAPAPASQSPSLAPDAPAASPDEGAWTAVAPIGLAEVATLVPTEPGPDSVARTTGFRLTSLDGRPASSLAGRIVVEPPVELRITSSGATTAVLQPTSVLAAATRYRFSLARPDGTVEASWTARTAGPLHVTDTIPGDTATAVPVDAGVEVAFDQTGVAAAAFAAHFAISPVTAGRFVTNGRSIAFAPAAPLSAGTLYSVTVSHGLPLANTGEVLEHDIVVRFETASMREPAARVWFRDTLVDANPRERAAITVWTEAPEGEPEPARVPLTVHRLGGLDDALAAWTAVERMPSWTLVSSQAAVSTRRLPGVFTATVPVQRLDDGTRWIQLPGTLSTGWYVVTVAFAGVPRQVILQITDTATYALVTTTKTALWVNDLRTGGPAVGATASLAGTALSGAAGAQGLLVAATPQRVASGEVARPLLLVRYRGATTFRPISGVSVCGGCDGKGRDLSALAPDRYWTLLSTDRAEYRQTDTINVVGVVRARGSGEVPTSVRLVVAAESTSAVAIATSSVSPDSRGMYMASLPISDVPIGGYRVRATVGNDQVGEAWIQVSTIRKPAFLVTLTPAHHAVISGEPLQTGVEAAFFDGTPAAGTPLELAVGYGGAPAASVTTDATGRATANVRAPAVDSQRESTTIRATPTLPEEASLASEADVIVFAGSAYVTIEGVASPQTVTLTGTVNDVALARYDQPDASGLWSIDPRGAPRPWAVVNVSVVAYSAIRQQSGTAYDFVTKRVMPKYRYTEQQTALPTRSVAAGSDGSFRLTFAATRGAYAYDVTASYTDEAGREVVGETWTASSQEPVDAPMARLVVVDDHQSGYSVGDPIRVRFEGSTGATASRFLYLTVQQGLRSVGVSSSPSFETTFTDASIPDIEIGAVRFNGAGYDAVPWFSTARLDVRDRTMIISLTADKARYQPGETADVTVRTLDPGGQPVAASVFVRVVDEKLFAMGAASDDDPLSELYADVPDGVIGSARSHQTPTEGWGGGRGDTTGGGGTGGRTDFRDWLVAKVIHTDAQGRGTISVPLSDDLTSWRVSAIAVDAGLDAGAASVALPVGLSFFVDAVLASEYLAADRPILRVRSYGTSLRPGARVTFVVSSDTLPMTETTVTADAFGSAYLPLPALSPGEQRIRIAGSVVIDGQPLHDAMTRTFRVISRRATQQHTTWTLLTSPNTLQAGEGMTRLVLVDAGRGRVVPVLEELGRSGGGRSDQELASALANRVLAQQFGLNALADPDPNGLDAFAQDGGLSIVPWGSLELDVTALAGMAGDPRVDARALTSQLRTLADDGNQTRAGRILALAGLAALGDGVHDQIAALMGRTDLTVDEQVNLALAALEAGDEALAGKLEQGLLAQHASRSGHMVRLDAGPDADTTVVTARLAIVAAALGDPIAAEMDAYVAEHPARTTLVVLERVLAARGWAMRVPSSSAGATLTVGGARTSVTLTMGEAAEYTLTPTQATSALVTPTSGSVLAVQSWDGALEPSSLAAPRGVSFSRSVTPTGEVAADQTVIVEFDVSVPAALAGRLWRVVETVPSGLAPIPYYGGYQDSEESTMFIAPTFMDGQRVSFLVGGDVRRASHKLRYVARVVSPGTYAWEPAVLQSMADPTSGLTVQSRTVKIAAPAVGG
jgi:hypothetical protein